MGVQIAETESDKLSELLRKMPAIARDYCALAYRNIHFEKKAARISVCGCATMDSQVN